MTVSEIYKLNENHKGNITDIFDFMEDWCFKKKEIIEPIDIDKAETMWGVWQPPTTDIFYQKEYL